MYKNELYDIFYPMFTNKNEVDKAIGISFQTGNFENFKKNPVMDKFLGLSNETWPEISKQGYASLRVGVYFISSEPFYKENLVYPTFAAKVLYYSDEIGALISYTANIGPLLNVNATYIPQPFSVNKDPLVIEFINNRARGNRHDYYKEAKQLFFNSVFINRKIIIVKKSIFDPSDTSSNRAVTWSFVK